MTWIASLYMLEYNFFKLIKMINENNQKHPRNGDSNQNQTDKNGQVEQEMHEKYRTATKDQTIAAMVDLRLENEEL